LFCRGRLDQGLAAGAAGPGETLYRPQPPPRRRGAPGAVSDRSSVVPPRVRPASPKRADANVVDKRTQSSKRGAVGAANPSPDRRARRPIRGAPRTALVKPRRRLRPPARHPPPDHRLVHAQIRRQAGADHGEGSEHRRLFPGEWLGHDSLEHALKPGQGGFQRRIAASARATARLETAAVMETGATPDAALDVPSPPSSAAWDGGA